MTPGGDERGDPWPRLAASLDRLPEEIDEDRRRAPALLAELLAEPPAVRERMAASLEHVRSIALAELLLQRSLEKGAESESLAELALAIAGVLDPTGGAAGLVEQVKARCWAAIGNACRRQGNLTKAEAAFHLASRHLAASPDPLEESLFHRLRALLLRDQGKADAAIFVQEKAVELLNAFGRPAAAAVSLIELAALHLGGSDPDGTIDLLRAATLVLGSEIAAELRLVAPE